MYLATNLTLVCSERLKAVQGGRVCLPESFCRDGDDERRCGTEEFYRALDKMNDGVIDRTSSATWRDPALDARWDRVAGGWSLSASTAAARGPESANPGESTNSGKFPLAGRWRLPGGRYQCCGRRAVGVRAYRSGGMVLDVGRGGVQESGDFRRSAGR